jgi:hypothetical protein
MKPTLAIAVAALGAAIVPRSPAQAFPAATRPGGEIRAGITYTNASTDFVPKRIGGFTVYGSFSLFPHFALETDIHLLQFFTSEDYAQRSYLAGGRFYYRKNRFEPYAKVMGGIAQSVTQQRYNTYPGAPDSYGTYALGGGLDIRAPHRLVIRAVDYEVQRWPAFLPNGLTPSMLSFGVAYQIR